MISKALDYALRALIYMAANQDKQYFGVKELAEKAQVSRTYLGKILQNLVKEGYLISTTGPGGGFGLARDSKNITLMELLEVLDGDRVEERCFLGLAECEDNNPCPIHATWKKCRADLLRDFRKTSVFDAGKKSWPGYK